MWKIIDCLFVLGLVDQALGQSTVLLSATMHISTDCLQADGASIGANCLELILVQEGDFFKLETLAGDPRMQLLLATEGNSLVAVGSGSSVKFTNRENNDIYKYKGRLTDGRFPYYIRLSDNNGAPGVCLKANGAAIDLCSEDDKWYFAEVNCKVTSCTTCNADALLCDACDANKIRNAEKNACEECSTLNPQCTACSETDGTKSCTACAAGYVTDATDICTDCQANQIVEDNACLDCGSGKTPHSNRAQCVDECTVDNCLYCDDAPGTCTECEAQYILAGNECTGCGEDQYVEANACKDCGSDMTVNSARDGCVDDCTDSNCKFCDDGPDTCGTCNDGYKVEDGECKDKPADDSDENVAPSVIPLSILQMVVLTFALLI